MENFVLVPGTFQDESVIVVDPAKKLKLRDSSISNVRLHTKNVVNFSTKEQDAVGGVGVEDEVSIKDITTTPFPVPSVPESDVKVDNDKLGNIQVTDLKAIIDQSFEGNSSRLIRLTDSMNGRAQKRIASLYKQDNEKESSVDSSIKYDYFDTNNSDSNVSVDVSTVDTQEVANDMNDAFTEAAKVENIGETKKVGHSDTKARVEKYSVGEMEMTIPEVGHINDSIFAANDSLVSATSSSSSNLDNSNSSTDLTDEDINIRVMPIVVSERKDRDIVKEEVNEVQASNRFLFDENAQDKENKEIDIEKEAIEEQKLNELKKYEDSFADRDDSSLLEFSDMINFEEARSSIEKAKAEAKSLEEKEQEEAAKLQKAVDKCNDELAEYRDVCQQVKSYIISFEEANNMRKEQIGDLVAKRQAQEARAATIAHQREVYASLIPTQEESTKSDDFVKRMAA